MSDARPETRDEAHWAALCRLSQTQHSMLGGAWRDQDGTNRRLRHWLGFRLIPTGVRPGRKPGRGRPTGWRAVCLVIVAVLVCFGLTAVNGGGPASADTAPPPIPTCTPDIPNCTPPDLLNDALLTTSISADPDDFTRPRPPRWRPCTISRPTPSSSPSTIMVCPAQTGTRCGRGGGPTRWPSCGRRSCRRCTGRM